MPKAKVPKDVKEPKEVGAKSRAEKEPVEEAAPPAIENEAVRARREARSEGFKALGDPIRLAICEYLAVCAPSEQTAGAVCRAVTGDKKINAKVSHHLKELRRAGLIVMHKNGKNVLCALDAGGTKALSAYLSSWTLGADGINTLSETKTRKASRTNGGDSTNGDPSDNTKFLDESLHAVSHLANAA